MHCLLLVCAFILFFFLKGKLGFFNWLSWSKKTQIKQRVSWNNKGMSWYFSLQVQKWKSGQLWDLWKFLCALLGGRGSGFQLLDGAWLLAGRASSTSTPVPLSGLHRGSQPTKIHRNIFSIAAGVSFLHNPSQGRLFSVPHQLLEEVFPLQFFYTNIYSIFYFLFPIHVQIIISRFDKAIYVQIIIHVQIIISSFDAVSRSYLMTKRNIFQDPQIIEERR